MKNSPPAAAANRECPICHGGPLAMTMQDDGPVCGTCHVCGSVLPLCDLPAGPDDTEAAAAWASAYGGTGQGDLLIGDIGLDRTPDPASLLRSLYHALGQDPVSLDRHLPSAADFRRVSGTVPGTPRVCLSVALAATGKTGPQAPGISSLGLRRLAARCGFATEAMIEQEGRLRFLLRRKPPPNGHGAATSYLAAWHDRRRVIADALVRAHEAGRPAALWGAGTDFTWMLTSNETFAALANGGKLIIFDQRDGIPARPPTEIANFSGPVFLTPLSEASRAGMKRFAANVGFPPERLIDAYNLPWLD